MLQQTQASVVIPYFERWMDRFPTIEDLAHASEEEVIKLWEGLGYYSRARNLHRAAKALDGPLPSTEEELLAIKGLGPYTAGAILSFAFKQRAAAVDGNVLRVITRYLGLEEDISKAKTRRLVKRAVEDLLPEDKPYEVMEGLIELGALVCKKEAKCLLCPLQNCCEAHKRNATSTLPINSKKTTITELHRLVAVIEHEGKVLVRKGEEGKLMAGLYQFPYFETDSIVSAVRSLELEPTSVSPLSETSHSFTRFRARLYPYLITIKEERAVLGFEWIPFDQLVGLPFCSGHRKVLNEVESL